MPEVFQEKSREAARSEVSSRRKKSSGTTILNRELLGWEHRLSTDKIGSAALTATTCWHYCNFSPGILISLHLCLHELTAADWFWAHHLTSLLPLFTELVASHCGECCLFWQFFSCLCTKYLCRFVNICLHLPHWNRSGSSSSSLESCPTREVLKMHAEVSKHSPYPLPFPSPPLSLLS